MICWIITPNLNIFSPYKAILKDDHTLWHATGDDKIIQCQGNFHGAKSILSSLNFIDWADFDNRIIAHKIVVENYHELMDDKICAQNCLEVLYSKDITKVLQEYACNIAESLLSQESDSRSLNVIRAKRNWLDDKISTDDLNNFMIEAEKVHADYHYCHSEKSMKTSPTGAIPSSACGNTHALMASGWMFRQTKYSSDLELILNEK